MTAGLLSTGESVEQVADSVACIASDPSPHHVAVTI
jgi:hypothetical protein